MKLSGSLLLLLVSQCVCFVSCSDIEHESLQTNGVMSMRTRAITSDYYYYYKGEKIALSSIKNIYYVSAEDSLTLCNAISHINEDGTDSIHKGANSTYWKYIEGETGANSHQISSLRGVLAENQHIAPVFGEKANIVGTSEFFYVKVKDVDDINALKNTADINGVEIIEKVPYLDRWYMLKAPTSSCGLDMSNLFYETGLFEDVDPAFMFNFQPNNCTGEPEESNQWGLSKMNMCEAWNITKGKSNITIAVLDQGVDNNHSEFSSNYSPFSYDIATQSSPSVLYGNHGTHVGGIMGANHNGKFIAGIAPLATLLSISHSLRITQTLSKELATGIGYANAKGADVINNSWGDQGGAFYNNMHSSILEDAINDALKNGRNGKGMIVVFASGNKNKNPDYPGNCNPDNLVVGSINSSNKRSSYSSYGTSLDVIAPGENIWSTLPYNKTGYMSGTSMAAPHVAGLAALILSVNPNLTGKQVVAIIEKTARKVPGYSYTNSTEHRNGTWNNETGYGLCDAYTALMMASSNTTFNDMIVTKDTWVYGWDVSSQNVSVSNNAELTFSIGNKLTINSPFVVKEGAELSIY